MGILTGKTGSVYIISTSTAFSTEATDLLGDTGDSYVYQIGDTAKRMWNPNTAITHAGDSGGVFDESYYDNGVNWFTGKIKLTASGDTSVTVTGEYITLQKVGEVHGFTYGMTLDSAETTEVGDTWKTNMGLGKSVSVTMSRYRFDNIFDLISGDEYALLKLYTQGKSGVVPSKGFWVKVLVSQLTYTKGLNAIDTEALTFTTSTKPLNFTEV